MKYENIEEEVNYLKACENVKKIANAIKAIRIKYYPNFSKISEQDQDTYNQLKSEIEKIAHEYGLNRLRVELMSEIDSKYGNQDTQENSNTEKSQDDILNLYRGAKDAERQALSEGKLKKAKTCQKIADSYMQQLEGDYVQIAIEYKRGRFAELSPVSEKTNWASLFEKCADVSMAQSRAEITQYLAQSIKDNVSREEEVIR